MKLQFRLRTLMIVVTVLAVPLGYVGWQAKIVQERAALLEKRVDMPFSSVTIDETKDAAIPLVRVWLGDHFCARIRLKNFTDADRYKAAFPEADILPEIGPD